MKAFILAAGSGERLEPITHTRPKAFVPILSKPLIEYQIEYLRKCGIRDITVIVSSKNKEYFEKKLKEISIVTQKDDIKGTGAAILSAKFNDEALIINGDLFFSNEKEICNIITLKENAIIGVKVSNPKDYGVLVLDNQNNLSKIIEKPEIPPSNLINAGIYKLNSDIFTYLDKISISERGELELTDAINLMAKDHRVKVIEYEGYWMDIGKPWNIIDVNKWALDNLVFSQNLGNVEDNVKIKGKVIIEEDAEIKSGTYIEGPVYIGKGSEIGPNSYLRPYTILVEKNKIGASVEVKESVIMEGSKIPHLSYVGDSVIAEDVNFGAGTLIANLRFDEKEVKVNVKGKRISSGRRKLGAFIGGHVRTGINVTILPGVKIGAYARIYPGAVVNRDVGYGEFFKVLEHHHHHH
uniref:Dual sugar-1-phosphate nucleotidylyltransferase n=1 Tax=Sulfurisphaera tokodaii (strain DSM 16993 / JCM 10545 / NBRC 100140 / 7) TaxID=273063 RepID=UPI000EFA302B|nr:Chain A, Dual sugar-1-phosphate nucleotidylyltransferase [Sulfurisphaera tokodaii str. 7]5Z09_B Chain B, Dual sugar-1-phosphate nucleotidylyltransferase [Sulfurisphaera tokodaii str. 7]5Z09_C Chain C, Dual sugar-1-phosphate nucleotidylyltransferase [Sulfurisphaera tokodaii str. 7]5Z09_D Chain D, Dual sugar-1-phosphate nucleotidylyltransferase [Sulfurisphaera tokodaii str. 7]5Z09_E Chain E, Dual sugar-1-phosphate nucleotidylyltransferase [Sulfurisphaera tokodaii str. 7]5Z09_F Chain F, Dual s